MCCNLHVNCRYSAVSGLFTITMVHYSPDSILVVEQWTSSSPLQGYRGGAGFAHPVYMFCGLLTASSWVSCGGCCRRTMYRGHRYEECPVRGPQNDSSALRRPCGSVASSDRDLQHTHAAKCAAVGLRISSSESEASGKWWISPARLAMSCRQTTAGTEEEHAVTTSWRTRPDSSSG